MADEYKSLTHSAQSIDNTITGLGTHVADTTIHVTAQNKTDWDNKQPALTTEQLSAVNSGITAEKLTADEDALADVIDRGAKNFAQTESGSATQYVQIKCSVPAGTYKVYLASLTSTDTDATNCQIYFLDENRQSIVSSRGLINRGNGVVSNNITVNSDAGWVWIYASDSLAHSSGDTISFSGAMCCTKAEWDVSHTYEPYALSNPILTPAAIKAVDEGAKNRLTINSGSGTRWINIPVSVEAGKYRVYFGTLTSDDTDATTCQACFLNSSSTQVSDWMNFNRGSNVSDDATLTSTATTLLLYSSNSYAHSEGDTVTFTNGMICTESDWAVSQKFVPYALSNPVLTQEVNWNVNQGVKNLIKLNPNTYTSGNVVVKLNDDGTVSVSLSSGSTANTTFSRAIKTITDLRDMDLILNGCPSGGNYSSGYALYISDDGTTKEKDEGNGVLVPKSTTVTTSYLALIVRSGTAINGTLTFKPMIRPAYITDSTFQPYALPNSILTPALIEQVNGGAKNISNWGASTSTISGVTFTINNDDKTVTTTGTATARAQKALTFTAPPTIKAGRYVLSGCPSGGEQSGNILYCLYIWDVTANARVASGNDTGNGLEFDWVPDPSHTYSIGVDVRSGSNASGLVFRPMISRVADYRVSNAFAPYLPSWQGMYAGEFQSSVTNLVDNLDETFIDKAHSRLNVYRYGKICFADISLRTIASALTGADTITATALSSELRPTSTFSATVMGREVAEWAATNLLPVSFSIDTNGVVALRTGTAHTSVVFVTGYISWLTAI